MLTTIIYISMAAIVVSMIVILIRLIKGPTTPDRVIALDSLGICLISVTALLSILLETSFLLEVVLLLGILAFIGTVSFGKYLEKGAIIERERDQ